MKNLLFLLATIGIIFTACEGGESVEEDNGSTPSTPKIELSQQNMEVEFEPTQYTVSVTSPYSWEAISKNDWIVVDTKSGIAGTKELKFSVLRNEELEIREGTIVVKNEDANLFAELYVTQKAFVPAITIEPESLAFAADGGTQEVTITTNIEYEFSKDVDWLTLEKSEKGVKVTVTVNNKQEERTAKFSISNEKYKLTKSISISQVASEVVLDLYIASMDIEGPAGDIVIDREKYTATIPLAEETNIEAVKFNNITFGCEVVNGIGFIPDITQIRVSKDLNNRVVNMTAPEYITLSYFQTYEWKIVATQTINRIWTVDGQIGATEWDLEGHRAIVKRRQDYPLDNVQTIDLRFGPRPTYAYPEIVDMPTNFDNSDKSQTVTVSAHGRSTIWELVIVPTKVALDFEYVAAGANVIWIKAANIDGASIQFAYRKRGSEEWLKVKDEWYAANSSNPYNRYEEGFVKAVVRGLEPNVEYEVIGYADEKQSDIKIVTTAPLYQIPNSQMEEWGKFTNDQKLLPTGEVGPCWYPFSSVQHMFWATGNPSGTSHGEKFNLTYPVYKSDNPENVPSDSTGEVSAFMGSQNVLNMKFAAGNLFVGYYGETLGTNAKVYFGRQVDQNIKPVAMRFKIKYERGNTNYVNNKAAALDTEYHIGSKQIKITGGQPDLAKVFFCLTDWKESHCVYSADETTFFDPRTAAGVNGLGYFDSDNNPEMIVEETKEWHTMTLPIEYVNPEIVPSCLVLTFTCSGYGDYFTGSNASWMYVDDIELLYDLDENNQPK